MQPGTKHFRKRDAILQYLRDTDEHPSAEAVYAHMKQQIPDLSLGTVYRNLSLFKQQGLIASLGAVGGVERFDGNMTPHVHFICTRCACIRDLPQIRVPEELTAAAAGQANASVEQCQLTFTGICNACTN